MKKDKEDREEQEEKQGERRERGEKNDRDRSLRVFNSKYFVLRQSSFQRALLYYVWRCPQAVILPLPKKIKHEREKHIKVYNVSKESKSGQHNNLPKAPPPVETLSEGVTSSASHTRQDSRGGRRGRGPRSGLRQSRPPDASM